MKRTLTGLVLVLLLALLAAPAFADSWTGWITDSGCGAKGANAEHAACAKKCADGGAKLVFYNNADEKIYGLDKQDVALEHLGHEVTVTGTADGQSIAVESIAASAATE